MTFKFTLLSCLVTFAIGLLSLFCLKLYNARKFFRQLQSQDLPMPPHHWLLGHLSLAAQITKSLAPYAAGGYIADQVRQRYPDLNAAFYLDVWPFSRPVLAILDPDMMHQLTQQGKEVAKDPGLRTFLQPLTGKEDLVTMEGATWKRWRSIFNPGFSANHITSLIPDMVDKVLVFRDILAGKAQSGELFHLEQLTLKLTIDIIGGAVMDHEFHSQTRHNRMTAALRRQLQWCTMGIEMNPLDNLKNFIRPIVHAYNTSIMNKYLTHELEQRYSSVLDQQHNPGKSVIDLALKAYVDEYPNSNGIPAPFKSAAMAQIKLFIFAGHDTTSTATVFTFHLLYKHPEVLKRLREEHDAVLGPTADVPSRLASKPRLLNQLTYTLASIKEALRIYPTVSTIRNGEPDLHLSGPDGRRFPTENCMIWGDHYSNHHNPRVWDRPEEYLPERWLCAEGDPLYPPKHAWRPFEKGPRNCIGQELALTEIKIILALTIRDFDILDAYAEFDKANGGSMDRKVNRQRAYMVRIGGGGHPADGYPCRARSLA
ncbi:cytochrome P450 [Polyplosphaeria fusca]|uniref:Cytochrome P450 n=1 Tax=Polyplosphaeria fusca TaxID=682080 RepID=A0A9P4QKB7_9PLEO|nr:cytochrome P450 [Polyplosphaeria fusca]